MNDAHMVFCASPEWRQIVEELILPDVLRGAELGDDVIEIGPGPGFTTDVLRARTARLTAVEVDESLAVPLAARLEGTNVHVVLGDATALEFADASFSGAASFHMLHHVDSAQAQDRVLGELARVLRPGGTMVAADGTYSKETEAFHADDVYNPIDPGSLQTRLRDAGFASAEVGHHDLGWFCVARR